MWCLHRLLRVRLTLVSAIWMLSPLQAAQLPDKQLVITAPPGFGEIHPGRVETKPLDQSPFSLAEREAILKEKDHQRSKGWTPTSELEVGEIDAYFEINSSFAQSGKRNLDDLINQLRIIPASFSGTRLRDAQTHLVATAGGYVNGGWTGLVRVMNVPKWGRVVLEEYDYIEAGSHINIAKEIVDFEINDRPGMFTVWKSPSQRSFTEIEWFTENKHFRLLLGGAVSKSSEKYQHLIELVQQLR